MVLPTVGKEELVWEVERPSYREEEAEGEEEQHEESEVVPPIVGKEG